MRRPEAAAPGSEAPLTPPAMAGLARFVATDKGDFIGRDAFLSAQAAGPPQHLVLLQVESPDAGSPLHAIGEPIGNGHVRDGTHRR